MSATLPPMHAALSVLGTMAGQYLAAQAQSQAQPPQAQPAFNAPSTQQTTTNAVSLCNVCPLSQRMWHPSLIPLAGLPRETQIL